MASSEHGVTTWPHLLLHHGSLLCTPAVVRVVGDGGGTAKVTQLNGPLGAEQQVLNL